MNTSPYHKISSCRLWEVIHNLSFMWTFFWVSYFLFRVLWIDLQILSAAASAQLCVLCILLLIYSYMFRRSCHPQGAIPMLLKRTEIKSVTIIIHDGVICLWLQNYLLSVWFPVLHTFIAFWHCPVTCMLCRVACSAGDSLLHCKQPRLNTQCNRLLSLPDYGYRWARSPELYEPISGNMRRD
jgi:hypothetical protein